MSKTQSPGKTPTRGKASTRSKTASRGASRGKAANSRKWSADVTEHSDALDLEPEIFRSDDPDDIAASLTRSAKQSHRRKASPFRSAMSMLVFYINRAGKNLSAARRRTLEAAKNALRRRFRRPARH